MGLLQWAVFRKAQEEKRSLRPSALVKELLEVERRFQLNLSPKVW